jgi:hypothetical protein
MLFVSINAQLPGLLEGGGLAVLKLPLASFKVLIPPLAASSLALFNIVAAASALE